MATGSGCGSDATSGWWQRMKCTSLSGVRSGAPGTPTFFVQGLRFDGDWRDPSSLVAALEAA